MKNENVNFPLSLTEHNGAFVEYPFSKWDFDTKWSCTLKQ